MTTLDLAQLHCVTVCVEAYTYLCYTDGSLSSSVHCDSSCPAVWSTHRWGRYRHNMQWICTAFQYYLSMPHLQLPRKLFATSKPTRTAPTSPSPGTLWIATTPPATSIPSASTTARDQAVVTMATLALYLTQTVIWLRLVLPSSTPQLWPAFIITGSMWCGCMWAGLVSHLLLLTLIKFMLK